MDVTVVYIKYLMHLLLLLLLLKGSVIKTQHQTFKL